MLQRFVLTLLFALPACCQAGSASAEVTPNMLFGDNAVLQRDVKLPVWGTATGSEKVTVRFAGQEVSSQPADGRWQVELAPLAASSQPATLTVTQGDTQVERKNILVGDVWICGGQSNMRWMVNQAVGGGAAIATAANDKLRLFTVNRAGVPMPTANADQWLVTNPESVPTFSAVGYYFGRELQPWLRIPVGLINSNVGGTDAALDEQRSARGQRRAQSLYNAPVERFMERDDRSAHQVPDSRRHLVSG